MKKIIAILLSLVMVLSLVACGNKTDGEEGTDVKTDGETTQVVEDASDIKIALLVTNLGDMSFFDSAAEGVNKAAEDFGVDVKIIEMGNEPNNFETNLIDAADSGYDVIMTSITLQDAVENNSEDYPETAFVLFDGELEWDKGDYSNVYCITYKANEASFLGGYVSAALSESGVLGFLGGIDQPIINDFLMGYIQGAQEYNPDVKVIATYAGSYQDPSKGKELTIGMINQGADVSFNVAGGTGVGLIEASQENGSLVLGVDSDQAMKYEAQGQVEFAEIIPTSVLKNVGDSLYRAIDLYVKGELKLGQAEDLGIAEGGVGLADNHYYQEMVPADVRDSIAELEEKILNGEIEVSSAMGMTTDQISEIRDAVRP